MINNVSIVIVSFNHEKYLEKALDSLPLNTEVIVVDNGSTDNTIALIEEEYPHVKLIKSNKNLGFGSGINLGVKSSTKEYLVILNPDTIAQANSIDELIKPLITEENIITVPKVMLYNGSKINTCGNIEHFTGVSFTRGLGKNKECHDKIRNLTGLSGVCFALKKNLYQEIGGFDENIFLYMEDVEISWRINSLGLKIRYIPRSVFYHDYKLNVTAEKIYNLEIGRYIILRKYFTWKQFLMFLPSIFVTELFTFGYAFLKGSDGIKYKLNAIRDGLKADVKKIDVDRKELVKSLDWKIPTGQLSHNLLDKIFRRIGNFVYFINYYLIINIWTMKALNIKKSDIDIDYHRETFSELSEKSSK